MEENGFALDASESMGNIPFCDCLDVRKGSVDVKFEALEKQRIEAVGKLFELTDLNGDGLITAQEFALMGLYKTKAHTEKAMMPHDEQAIKGLFIEKFAEEIDMSLKPMNFRKYKEYICRSVNNMDPGDMEAQSLIFDGLLVEATLAREMVEESKALSSEASLPTLLTGNFDSHSMPKPLYSFV
eukprot:symbB.v1.2.006319.t2/scaffold354.1/size221495/14